VLKDPKKTIVDGIRRRRGAALLLPFVLAASILLMPWAAGQSGAQSGRAMVNLKVQLSWLDDVEFSGIYMAIHNGYFKKYGLNVTTAPGGVNVDPRSVVANGAAQIGTVAEGTDVVVGISHGAPIQAFAAMYQKNPGCLLVMNKSHIKSAKDLIGKTIGIQNNARDQIDGILQYNHIPLSKVKIQVVGTSTTPLLLGKIDAFTAFAFNEPVALALKGYKVSCLSFSDIGLPAYGDAMVAKTSMIKSQPQVLAEFVKAVQKGWQYTLAHPTHTANVVLKTYAPQQDKKQQHAQMPVELSLIKAPGSPGLLGMTSSVWQRSIQFMKSEKVLARPVTVSDVMTQSIFNRAKTIH
jgi:NitT/TauT family transport system substrate-binding protein